MNHAKVLEAAERVLRAKEELRRAEEDFDALMGGKSTAPKPIRGRAPGPAPSVSQRVLGLITNAGTAGIKRADMVAVLGKESETAIHSALKVHQSKGLVVSKDGAWVATKKLVQKLQAPPTTADAALLA